MGPFLGVALILVISRVSWFLSFWMWLHGNLVIKPYLKTVDFDNPNLTFMDNSLNLLAFIMFDSCFSIQMTGYVDRGLYTAVVSKYAFFFLFFLIIYGLVVKKKLRILLKFCLLKQVLLLNLDRVHRRVNSTIYLIKWRFNWEYPVDSRHKPAATKQ